MTYEKCIFWSEDYTYLKKNYINAWQIHCECNKIYSDNNGLIELNWTRIIYKKWAGWGRCFSAIESAKICPTLRMSTNSTQTYTCIGTEIDFLKNWPSSATLQTFKTLSSFCRDERRQWGNDRAKMERIKDVKRKLKQRAHPDSSLYIHSRSSLKKRRLSEKKYSHELFIVLLRIC